MDLINKNDSEETINVKEIINKYLSFWYFFLISIGFCLFIAFLYNRYTEPIYSASTTVLIRDDNNSSLGAENLLEGLELFSGKKNLKNEIGILESFDLTKKTLENLEFQTSYYYIGKIRTNELYKNVPFKIDIDSNQTQTLGIAFNILIIDSTKFNIEIKAKDVRQFLPNQNIFIKKQDGFKKQQRVSFKYNETHYFNEKIETDYFTFTINKHKIFNSQFIDKKYYFVFHDLNNLTLKKLKKLSIKPINKDASIIKLKSEGPIALKELDFLNKLAENYIQLGLDEKNQMAANTITFINQQLNDISDSLNYAENRLENFKEKNPKIELSYKDYGTFFQIEQLEKEKSILEVNDKYYRSLLNYLKENDDIDKIVAPSAMGINDPLLNSLINNLSNLYSEKTSLEINTTKQHPIFQSLLRKIENGKKSLTENVNNIIKSSEISIKNINKRIKSEEKLINNLPQSERVLVNIQRKFNLNESIYTYLLEKRAEAAIALAGNVADHKVLDVARLENKLPIKPKKGISYLVGLIFGFILPIIVITIKEFFNTKIITKKDITKLLDYPIIGNVLEAGNSEHKLIVIEKPKAAISESFRSIRTNIQYLASEEKSKVMTVTSSISGEGKTYCALNLGTVLSQAGEKVLLIDGDMRKPKIAKALNLDNKKGLSNFLINDARINNIIIKTKVNNLDIIVAGPVPPNPSELLSKEILLKLIKEAKKKYDYIIFDTPPVGLVTDGLILMKNADIKLCIIRQNYSIKKMVSHVNDIFNQKNLKDINLIVNGITQDNLYYGGYTYGFGSYGYGYGYGYYSEDGKKNQQNLKINFLSKIFSRKK